MADFKEVKIALLTGYLGAGKTTILNHILSNTQGIRAAVIVNDIGEINVDASLIRDGGYAKEGDVIPLTNGCLCCTLSNDLALQLGDLVDTGEFDYIIIEASGICEPIPITYNISAFCNQSQHTSKHSHVSLDNIIAVVDCARMYDEFNGGKALLASDIEEDDIESLLIQQIEFCSTLVLNKTDLVTAEQLTELKALVRGLQRDAVIVEAQNGNIPLAELINTGRFDFDKAYASAAWMDAMEHPEEHEDPEVLEYEITTFVYKRRKPFDLRKLNEFVSRCSFTRTASFMIPCRLRLVKHCLTRSPSCAKTGIPGWGTAKQSSALSVGTWTMKSLKPAWMRASPSMFPKLRRYVRVVGHNQSFSVDRS